LTGGTVAPDDAHGARRGDAVSGELTATLDASGVSTFRDVFAGEIVLLDDAGKSSGLPSNGRRSGLAGVDR